MGDSVYASIYRRGSGLVCKTSGIHSSGGSTPSSGTKKFHMGLATKNYMKYFCSSLTSRAKLMRYDE